jgi:protein tyrosine/serine phosphatase
MPHPQPASRNPRSSRRLIVLIGLLAVAAVAAGLIWCNNRLPREFAAVQPGVLYRCAQPTPSQLKKAVADYGVKTILIAREPSSDRVAAELEAAENLDLHVEQIPLVSRMPISDEHVRRFFEIVDDPANQPVLVHCSQGRHRTGYLCGLYRIERQGWTLAQAVEEMESFCADEDDTHVMVTLLRQYRPRGEGKEE